MLRTYLTLALRQLGRNRLYAALNIGGLSVGLAVSAYIGLYVWHEFHYDRFHPYAERTYRVRSAVKFGTDDITTTEFHETFGREIERTLPNVEQIVRVSPTRGSVWIQTDEQHRVKSSEIGFADPSFLSVMGFRLAQGDPKTALGAAGRIVLSQPLAEKLFGQRDPIGQVIQYNRKYPLTVSGVFSPLPTNTELAFDAMVSLASMPALGPENKDLWEAAGFLQTYLVVRPGTDVRALAVQLKKVNSGLDFMNSKASFALENIADLHLYHRYAAKDRQKLYIFLAIALAILLLAVTNYVSLTTARATQRAREVGVRKAIGGQRRELITQFYTESLLTTTLAFALGLGLLVVLTPLVNQQLGISMDERVLQRPTNWLLLGTLWAVCALLAGSYPAFLLSGFRPQEALKSITTTGRRGVGVRRVLTMGQFAASAGLLMCSLVFYTQMRYLRTKNIGLNRAQVVAIELDKDMTPQYIAFRDAVRQWAGADKVAATNTRLFTSGISTWFLKTKKAKKNIMMNALTVDASFFNTLGFGWRMTPVGWSKQPLARDIRVYNEQAIRESGETVQAVPHPDPFNNNGADVAGIVRNFNLFGLQRQQTPAMFTVVSDTSRAVLAGAGGCLLVRLNPGQDVPVALGQLKLLYDQANSNSVTAAPFDYYFLDDAYNTLYQSEQRIISLVNGFTVLTLLVACLGLLGLMTFTVEARTKEIGIRKLLGASVASILGMLSRELIWLVALAVVIATPVAWWAMNAWLGTFAYKITIAWWVFAGAGTLAMAVALFTVSFQSIRAALANPVDSLRSE